jgi:hypothetical protein
VINIYQIPLDYLPKDSNSSSIYLTLLPIRNSMLMYLDRTSYRMKRSKRSDPKISRFRVLRGGGQDLCPPPPRQDFLNYKTPPPTRGMAGIALGSRSLRIFAIKKA